MNHSVSQVCSALTPRWIIRRRLLLLSAVVLLVCGPVWAQKEQPPADTATVRGTVTDEDGEAIVGAALKLHLNDSNTDIVSATDAAGHFEFLGIAAQHVELSIKATGFGTSITSLDLHPGQTSDFDPITLKVAANLNVEVSALTQVELAEQQIHVEEHQRLLGVLPNFFVSYTWKAAPLTSKQKFELAWKTTIDPVNIGIAAATAGVEQAQNHFAAYGPGISGYGKRFGANYADLSIGTLVGGAIFPSLLHQDPRYFYKGTGSIWARAGYALATAVICRGDNGRWQPSYSGILGDLAAGAATNLYYPAYDRSGLSQTFTNSLVSVAFDGLGNLIQEFVLRKLTPGTHKPSPPPSPSNP